MIKKIILVLLFVFLVSFMVFILFIQEKEYERVTSYNDCASSGYPVIELYPEQCIADGKIFIKDIGNELEKTDIIILNTPRPQDTVSFPLTLSGRARGPWFFEASFPAEILDGDGKSLGFGIMTAQDEWMTTEFVPFSGTLEINNKNKFPHGTIVLHKDNPSGEERFDDKLIVPIIFGE